MAEPQATGLLVECRDEPGVLYRVAEAIFRHGANITYVAGGARREAIAELQLEVSGAPDRQRLIADLEAVQGVTRVGVVPTFQMIYGKRVIVIGGGAQVGGCRGERPGRGRCDGRDADCLHREVLDRARAWPPLLATATFPRMTRACRAASTGRSSGRTPDRAASKRHHKPAAARS